MIWEVKEYKDLESYLPFRVYIVRIRICFVHIYIYTYNMYIIPRTQTLALLEKGLILEG